MQLGFVIFGLFIAKFLFFYMVLVRHILFVCYSFLIFITCSNHSSCCFSMLYKTEATSSFSIILLVRTLSLVVMFLTLLNISFFLCILFFCGFTSVQLAHLNNNVRLNIVLYTVNSDVFFVIFFIKKHSLDFYLR